MLGSLSQVYLRESHMKENGCDRDVKPGGQGDRGGGDGTRGK